MLSWLSAARTALRRLVKADRRAASSWNYDDEYRKAGLEVTNAGTMNFTDAFTANHFKDVTADSGLVFAAGTTYTITGTLDLNGGVIGNEIILNSSDNATRFTFNVTGGVQNVYYVMVSNSEASSNNILATFSIKGTNTDAPEGAPRWVFVGSGPLRGAVMHVD